MADDGDQLVHWTPPGSAGVVSTSRGMPEREGLSPNERQIQSLAECRWNYTATGRGVGLSFVKKDSWSRVKVTWDPPGEFLHWYVDFQLPPLRQEAGYDTCDLVIDILVLPDRSWGWKDRADFEEGVRRGVFSAEMERSIFDESAEIIDAIEAGTGPFQEKWCHWRPDPKWEVPTLSPGYERGLQRPEGSRVQI